ncbi:MAG: hypothetical protein JXX29_21490 [Deltaproteobacteria bacterium]|nr:hypothetical protein [Deltaproteobacteria bacterium]MBN2674269.1 hypothetical protein [Deltaproteobacteria bacterium]
MHRHVRWMYLLLLAFGVVMFSCGPYEGPILNPKVLKKLAACPKPAVETSAKHSYNVVLSVLIKNGWTVRSTVPQKFHINARKCKPLRRYKDVDQLERKQSDCLDLHFEIGPTGAVGYTNPQPRRFHWKIEPKVKKWVSEFETDFNAVRCYSPHDLKIWRESN